MLLVVDVGNTNTSLGIYGEGQLRASWRLTTRRGVPAIAALSLPLCAAGAAAASLGSNRVRASFSIRSAITTPATAVSMMLIESGR